MRKALRSVVVLLLFATTLVTSPGGVSAQDGALYDESVDGEITDDASNPLALALGGGSNILNGTVTAGDIDYVTVNVPEGYVLSTLDLVSYESGNDRSFIGIQEGTTFTEPPADTDVTNLLGFTLFGTATLGTDILPAIGTAEGTQGFSGPLPAGDYTFWIQETADTSSIYSFNLNTAPAADDSSSDDASAGDAAVQFTFENLQPADGFFFTEPWVGLHDGGFDLFNDGERASPGLESLAEGGNTELLGEEFAAPGRLQTTIGNGEVQFISPGEIIEGSIDIINPAAYRYFSFASMMIPSNDAFFGNEDPTAYELFDADGNFTGPVTIDLYAADIYDSGTEVNDALGAAGFSLGPDGTGGGESTDDPTGTVAVHPDLLENILGIQTAAGTTVTNGLTAEEPIARITVSAGDSLVTQSAVGPAFNGSVVDAPAPAPAPAADVSTNVQLDLTGLEPLGEGFVYEGWVIIDGAPVSTGRFNIEADGSLTFLTGSLADDVSEATTVVITIEPADDPDPGPAAPKPLAGDVVDGVAELSVGHPAALGDDFSGAGGQFLVATPTTADNPDDDYSGVWFIEVTDAGPVQGLDLPTLPEGWVYEGWAVIDGQPVSTGRFVDPGAPDDFSGFSGPDGSPPFPGEDFIVNAPDGLSFPTDLRGDTVVISIEPADDDSPAPFAFKPLAAEIPADLEVPGAVVLGAGPALPTGVATLELPPAAVQFTFENLQPADGFFFTEPWVGLHDGGFDLFNDGERASPGLESLAEGGNTCLLYTSPSPRDGLLSRMPSSA